MTGEFPVARLDFPNGGWWLSSTVIAGAAVGGFGFTTIIFVVGIVFGGAGSGIGARATPGRGLLVFASVCPPLRRLVFIRGPVGFLIVGGGWRRRFGGRSLLSG